MRINESHQVLQFAYYVLDRILSRSIDQGFCRPCQKVQGLPPSCLKRDWPFFVQTFLKLCNCAKLYGSIEPRVKDIGW